MALKHEPEAPPRTSKHDDLERYREAARTLETTRSEIEELEHTEAFEVFQKQLGLLRRRLLNSSESLRQMFIDDGMQADRLGVQAGRARPRLHQDAVEPPAARRRRERHAPSLRLERAAQVQAQVHRRDRRASVRPLSVVQGPVAGLAWTERHSSLHPVAGGAGERLRTRQPGLPRLHEPRLQRARGRPLRLARDAARQAVRGPRLRAWRAAAGQASPRAAARSRFTFRRCCASWERASSRKRSN